MISFKRGNQPVPVSSLGKQFKYADRNVRGGRGSGRGPRQCKLRSEPGPLPICSELEYATAIRVRLD
jgi:hypothetical protein